jgi:hypothetical protein
MSEVYTNIVETSILKATTDSGDKVNLAATGEGHLEVAIHSPRGPFGSVLVESLYPIFQSDAVYGLLAFQQTSSASGTGSADANNSAFRVQTGTTIYSQASIQSRKRLRYRPGQGVVGRFTAKYTSPVALSYQVVGFGHAEDGVFVGYKNLEFGVLYSVRGKREVRTLTISTKSSHAENAVVTLNGTAFNVPVTNGTNTTTTANEVAAYASYTGWKADAVGNTVVFVKDAVGVVSGSFSITGTSVVGSFAQSSAGQASTETWIPQASFNGDKLDGTGNSDFTIDPTKFNVFQAKSQYLGAGAITFEIEIPLEGNNPDWVVFHSIELPNTLTATSFGNPSFPFTMAVYSAGSTTNLTVEVGSYAGFIEGEPILHGTRASYVNILTNVGAANYQALFSVKNMRYFKSRTNQAVIRLVNVAGAIKHNSPVIYYLVKNATLAGATSWSSYATDSCSLFDNTSTTVSFADNAQIVWSGHLGDTGEIDHFINGGNEEVELQPGEWVTLCAKSTTGTPSYVTGSLNTREDK